jgi:SAM-dependent methyltransferase
MSWLSALPAFAQTQSWAWDDGTVPYVNTPMEVVERMLRMAEVHAGDYVIDLGSGDGRIVIEAAKRGARGLGVDLDPALVKLATRNAGESGVADRARFEVKDIFDTDLSRASVITMYLLPDFNVKLKERLLALKPGTRIVSHDYPLTGWIPEKYVQMDLEDKVQISGVTTTLIYLYVVPAKVAGRWSAQMPPAVSKQPATLQLKQQLTRVSGSAQLDGKEVALEDVKLRGDRITFRLSGRRGEFSGQVKGSSIEGVMENGGAKAPWSATLGG